MNVARLSLIFAAAAVAVAVALSAVLLMQDRPQSRAGGQALIGGPFELVDQKGRAVTERDLQGRLALVYFGFTYCPDVCPTDLQGITAALDLLAADAAKVQPVFITIDPERDTVAQMGSYIEHFHPSFLALTGTPAQVATAAKAYRVYYARAKSDSTTEYLMDHSAFVYLMDREGRYLRHFAPNTPPEAMAAAIREHLG